MVAGAACEAICFPSPHSGRESPGGRYGKWNSLRCSNFECSLSATLVSGRGTGPGCGGGGSEGSSVMELLVGSPPLAQRTQRQRGGVATYQEHS